jgi:hypothetical protein
MASYYFTITQRTSAASLYTGDTYYIKWDTGLTGYPNDSTLQLATGGTETYWNLFKHRTWSIDYDGQTPSQSVDYVIKDNEYLGQNSLAFGPTGMDIPTFPLINVYKKNYLLGVNDNVYFDDIAYTVGPDAARIDGSGNHYLTGWQFSSAGSTDFWTWILGSSTYLNVNNTTVVNPCGSLDIPFSATGAIAYYDINADGYQYLLTPSESLCSYDVAQVKIDGVALDQNKAYKTNYNLCFTPGDICFRPYTGQTADITVEEYNNCSACSESGGDIPTYSAESCCDETVFIFTATTIGGDINGNLVFSSGVTINGECAGYPTMVETGYTTNGVLTGTYTVTGEIPCNNCTGETPCVVYYYFDPCDSGDTNIYRVTQQEWQNSFGAPPIGGNTYKLENIANVPNACYVAVGEQPSNITFSPSPTSSATDVPGGCNDAICQVPVTPTPTPTISLTPTISDTPTPTPTPSETPCTCKYIDVEISQTDIDNASGNSDPSQNGKVYLYYNLCDGSPTFEEFSSAGTYTSAVCALRTQIFNSILYYYRGDTVIDSGLESSRSEGSCCTAPLTPTPTVSVSDTPAVTPTITPTVSVSDTPAVTPTITPTVSVSDTPAVTPTITPTVSVSDTPAVTPTITPTVSVSDTPGSSSTPTPTPSVTPDVTPTNTPTVSVSDTPSVTPTITPTVSVSDTPGSSTTPTPTPSVTPDVTPTNTPTASVSETPSGTLTPTPTYTPTYTPSVTLSVTPTNTFTPSPSPSDVGNCVEAVTDGTYYYTDCCGYYRSGQSVGDLVSVDTTEPYTGLTINGTPTTQNCDEGDLDYNFSVTGTCSDPNGGVITIAPFAGVPPYTIDNIIPGTLVGGTSNQPFTWTGLSAGTYTFRLNDSLGDSNNEIYINVNIDGCLDAIIDDYSGTTCGQENGYLSVSGDSTSLPYLITLYKDTFVYSSQSYSNNPTEFFNLPNGDYYATVEDYGGATAQTQTVTISGVSSLDYGLSVTGTSYCGIGEGAISVTGLTGSSPFTYLWTNGATGDTITGLSGGTYGVTVTDSNGCELTKNAAVTVANGITLLSYTTTPTSCLSEDGQVTVYISGGTAPYTYAGQNGHSGTTSDTTFTFTGCSSGNFEFTITDAQNCSFTDDVNIGDIGGITSVDLRVDLVNCGSLGNATITVTGNGGPFTYSYTGQTSGGTASVTTSNTQQQFTNLLPDVYDYTVEGSNGCCYTGQFTVSATPKFQLTITSTGDTCNVGSGAIHIVPSSGYTLPLDYILSDGQSIIDTPLSAYTFYNVEEGGYTIQVIDGDGCSVTETINITGTTGVDVVITVTRGGYENPDVLSATTLSGVAPFTYLWNDGSTGSTLSIDSRGSYSVTVTDSNGCQDTATYDETESQQVVSSFPIVEICSDTFTTATMDKKGFYEYLNQGYLELVSDLGESGCTLNSAVFNYDINFQSQNATDSFYTGYTLSDVPSDEVWANLLETVIGGFTGISSIDVDPINNTIIVVGECGSTDFLDIDISIDYDLNCQTPSPTPTPTPTPTYYILQEVVYGDPCSVVEGNYTATLDGVVSTPSVGEYVNVDEDSNCYQVISTTSVGTPTLTINTVDTSCELCNTQVARMQKITDTFGCVADGIDYFGDVSGLSSIVSPPDFVCDGVDTYVITEYPVNETATITLIDGPYPDCVSC